MKLFPQIQHQQSTFEALNLEHIGLLSCILKDNSDEWLDPQRYKSVAKLQSFREV